MSVFTGIKGYGEIEVNSGNVAQALGSGSLPVFSTPSLLILMERTALESVQPYLEQNEGTVGMRVELDHLAASPIGMTVRAESELTEIKGRILIFKVNAYCGDELIGRCVHTRCIINNERFMEKATAKLNK